MQEAIRRVHDFIPGYYVVVDEEDEYNDPFSLDEVREIKDEFFNAIDRQTVLEDGDKTVFKNLVTRVFLIHQGVIFDQNTGEPRQVIPNKLRPKKRRRGRSYNALLSPEVMEELNKASEKEKLRHQREYVQGVIMTNKLRKESGEPIVIFPPELMEYLGIKSDTDIQNVDSAEDHDRNDSSDNETIEITEENQDNLPEEPEE